MVIIIIIVIMVKMNVDYLKEILFSITFLFSIMVLLVSFVTVFGVLKREKNMNVKFFGVRLLEYNT